MPTLCYKLDKDSCGNKIVAISGRCITLHQIIEIALKEFPETNGDDKKIGVQYENGWFGIRAISEEDSPYNIP